MNTLQALASDDLLVTQMLAQELCRWASLYEPQPGDVWHDIREIGSAYLHPSFGVGVVLDAVRGRWLAEVLAHARRLFAANRHDHDAMSLMGGAPWRRGRQE